VVRKVVKDEADKLIQTFGKDAYEKARRAVQDAKRGRNVRLERYLSQVATEIARRSAAGSD
jgi:hypothetical protein